MPPLYRMLEVCVYSLTNFLPFLAMALYPFRRRLRFSPAVAAALVYYVVARLVLEQEKLVALQQKNYALAMQSLQYENLQERIAEARQAKHDVRHHIALLQDWPPAEGLRRHAGVSGSVSGDAARRPAAAILRQCRRQCRTVLLCPSRLWPSRWTSP